MIFEIIILVLTISLLIYLYSKNKDSLKFYIFIAVGVLLFEYFTQALWINRNLESWAYLYLDVSWILTIMWADVIIFTLFLVERFNAKSTELKKFFTSVALVTIFVMAIEWILIRTGVRWYPEAILKLYDSTPRLFGIMPLHEIIYVFSFIGLILAFAKYWQINYNLKFEKSIGGKSK
jgi:hypothetical protein